MIFIPNTSDGEHYLPCPMALHGEPDMRLFSVTMGPGSYFTPKP